MIAFSLGDLLCQQVCWFFAIHFIKWQVIEAGANALVAGSAVFGAKDYAEGMASFQRHSLNSSTF